MRLIMRWPLKVLCGVSAVLVLAWGVLLGLQRWIDSRRIIAGPQNQSAFYKGYDPEEVFKRFRSTSQSYSSGSYTGAEQGTELVRHSKGYDPHFTIESRRKTELVTATEQRIRDDLQVTGTRVTSRFEEASGNFGYNYTTPNGSGSITVHLPVQDEIQRNIKLPGGLEDISVKIDLQEIWNRPR